MPVDPQEVIAQMQALANSRRTPVEELRTPEEYYQYLVEQIDGVQVEVTPEGAVVVVPPAAPPTMVNRLLKLLRLA